MYVADVVHEDPMIADERQTLWSVRVLLAAALERALRAGLDGAEIRALLDELIRKQGGCDV